MLRNVTVLGRCVTDCYGSLRAKYGCFGIVIFFYVVRIFKKFTAASTDPISLQLLRSETLTSKPRPLWPTDTDIFEPCIKGKEHRVYIRDNEFKK